MKIRPQPFLSGHGDTKDMKLPLRRGRGRIFQRNAMPEPLQVTAAEAGQKLLQFLSRRFEEPQSVLHRWIRTGQVRINGGRAKPFDRVELNDEIRVPPFAGAGTKAERVPASSGGKELPPIVAETADVIDARMKRACEEAEQMDRYDYLLINDEIDRCVEELNSLIQGQHRRMTLQEGFVSQMKQELKNISE